jgi:hypothetical protein
MAPSAFRRGHREKDPAPLLVEPLSPTPAQLANVSVHREDVKRPVLFRSGGGFGAGKDSNQGLLQAVKLISRSQRNVGYGAENGRSRGSLCRGALRPIATSTAAMRYVRSTSILLKNSQIEQLRKSPSCAHSVV